MQHAHQKGTIHRDLKPGTKLSGSDTLPSVAANRQIEPAKLSALVRGELDGIVMKALEKDRTRRYETLATVNNLAHVYQERGQVHKSLQLLQDVLQLTRDKLGPEHSTSREIPDAALEVVSRLHANPSNTGTSQLHGTRVRSACQCRCQSNDETLRRGRWCSMAYPAQNAHCFELSLPVKCGGGQHDVVVEVCPTGVRLLFNPCDVLPSPVRQLSARTCDEALPAHLWAVEQRLQYVWCDKAGPTRTAIFVPDEVFKDVDEFVSRVREQKESMAEQLLRECDDSAHAGESFPHARTWARVVLGRHDRSAARKVLANAGELPVAVVVAALCCADWSDDPFALWRLQQAIFNQRIVPELRARFAVVLGQHGDADHAIPLVDAMTNWRSGDSGVRTAAREGLHRLFARLIADESPTAGVHLPAPCLIPGAGPRTVLRDTLRLTFEQGHRKDSAEAVAQCFAGIGTMIFGHLVEFAEGRHGAPSQIVAIHVLGQMPDLRAFNLLLQIVCGADQQLRKVAMCAMLGMRTALTQIGDEAVPSLVELVRTGTEQMLMVFAMDTLGTIGSSLAVGHLAQFARKAPHPALRIGALEALGRGHHPRSAEALLSFLDQPQAGLQDVATEALVSTVNRLARDEAALSELLSTLSSGEASSTGPAPTGLPDSHRPGHSAADVIQIKLTATDPLDAVRTLIQAVEAASAGDMRLALRQALHELHARETSAGSPCSP